MVKVNGYSEDISLETFLCEKKIDILIVFYFILYIYIYIFFKVVLKLFLK